VVFHRRLVSRTTDKNHSHHRVGQELVVIYYHQQCVLERSGELEDSAGSRREKESGLG
jgi:hypothetical protein